MRAHIDFGGISGSPISVIVFFIAMFILMLLTVLGFIILAFATFGKCLC